MADLVHLNFIQEIRLEFQAIEKKHNEDCPLSLHINILTVVIEIHDVYCVQPFEVTKKVSVGWKVKPENAEEFEASWPKHPKSGRMNVNLARAKDFSKVFFNCLFLFILVVYWRLWLSGQPQQQTVPSRTPSLSRRIYQNDGE